MVGQVLFIKLAEGLVTCFVHQGVDFEETRVVFDRNKIVLLIQFKTAAGEF